MLLEGSSQAGSGSANDLVPARHCTGLGKSLSKKAVDRDRRRCFSHTGTFDRSLLHKGHLGEDS